MCRIVPSIFLFICFFQIPFHFASFIFYFYPSSLFRLPRTFIYYFPLFRFKLYYFIFFMDFLLILYFYDFLSLSYGIFALVIRNAPLNCGWYYGWRGGGASNQVQSYDFFLLLYFAWFISIKLTEWFGWMCSIKSGSNNHWYEKKNPWKIRQNYRSKGR